MSTNRKIITDEILLNGGLDSDSDKKFVQQGDYVDAKNVVNVEDSSGGVKVNIKGNEAVYSYESQGVEYLCGWAYYDKNESVILFIYSPQESNRLSMIIEFNPQTKVATTIVDSISSDILQFQNPKTNDYFIDAEMNGDWLAWTDNVNPPRMINVQDVKDGVVIDEEYLSLIKKPPDTISTVSLRKDDNYGSSKIYGKFFQFKSQYVLNDYRKTVWSGASDVTFDKYYVTQYDRFDSNYADNYIFISFNSGGAEVKTINIATKSDYDKSWYLVNRVNKEDPTEIYDSGESLITTSLSDDTVYYFKFFNDSNYSIIDVYEILKAYDTVPFKCESLNFIEEGRLTLGGVTEGFDLVEPSGSMSVHYNSQNTYSGNLTTSYVSNADGSNLKLEIKYALPNGTYEKGTVIDFYGSWLHEDSTSTSRGLQYHEVVILNDDYVIPDDNTALASYVNSIGITPSTTPDATSTDFSYSAGYFSCSATWSTAAVLGSDAGKASSALVLYADSVSKSFKRGNYYKFGLVYYDEYLRKFPIVTTDDYRVCVKDYFENTSNGYRGSTEIEWSITHSAPLSAKYYRWAYVKNNFSFFFARAYSVSYFKNSDDTDNDNLVAVNFYGDDNEYVTESNNYLDKYTIEAGDTISPIGYSGFSSSTSSAYFNKKRSFKVIDVKSSITNTDGDEKSGLWVIINPSSEDDWNGDEDSFVGYSTYEITKDIKNDSDEDKIFFEVGDIYSCTSGTHSVTSGTHSNGYSITQGDVYVRYRNVYPGSWITNYFLCEDIYPSDNVELKAYDFDLPNVVYDESQVKFFNLIRWSNKYFQDTRVNGLSTFDFDDRKQVSDTYGKVKGLQELGNSLVVICEEKVLSGFVGATEYTDTAGNVNVVKSTTPIGYLRPHAENYGTFLKESIVNNGKYIYFFDLMNGVVVRKSANGLFPISGKISSPQGSYDYKMRTYFKAKSKALLDSLYDGVASSSVSGIVANYEDVKCFMGYDPYYENIYITFIDRIDSTNSETIIFNEPSNKWISKYEHQGTISTYLSTLYPFTKSKILSFQEAVGTLYELNSDNVDRCYIYGQARESYIQFISHTLPNQNKVFNSIAVHSNKEWEAEPIETESNESYDYGQYTKILSSEWIIEEGVRKAAIPKNMKTRSSTASNYDRYEGEEMRGKVLKVKLTNDDTTKVELFKCDVKSELSR